MTRRTRRDKDTKNASVIAGLRMEPKLAVKLTAWALANIPRDTQNRTDVGAAARWLLYIGLGASSDTALRLEQEPRPSPVVPGLRLAQRTIDSIETHSLRLRLNRAATVRHLLRLQLGWTAEASLETEGNYAAIAEARRALMESV
jgi:hypothetical protein